MSKFPITKTIVFCTFFLAGSAGLADGKGGKYGVDAPYPTASPCIRCHNNLTATTTESGEDIVEDISFVERWSTTMMRFSFIDPLWRAKVRSETIALPKLQEAIEAKCTRCHAPMANEQAHRDGAPIQLFGAGGFLDPDSEYHLLARDGIACVLCHQIADPAITGQTSSDSGAFVISEEPVAWSKYFPDYATTMARNSGYMPTFGEHPTKSAFCAVCHDLYTDYYDANGDIQSSNAPLFPEQTPYQEWLASEFSFREGGTECQDCHMTRFREARIAGFPTNTQPRPDVYAHSFFTENTMMLAIIASTATAEGLEVPDLGEAMADGQDYLSLAGTIEVTDVAWDDDQTLAVTVKVANMAGHKLPTSIPLRRVFIHFAIYDGSIEPGELPLFSSGDTDSDGGLIGVDDEVQESGYEPHYEMITESDQVQVYEAVMGTTEGEVTTTLLRAARFLKDNRILPLGWNPAPEQDFILPVGNAATDSDFIGGEDTIVYKISGLAPAPAQEFTIEAELKDQTLAYPMAMAFTAPEYKDDPIIKTFLDEYQHHKVHFELIDATRVTVVRDPATE